MTKEKHTTHFGYQTVDADEKAAKVADVFTSVASRYDLMNDLMSLGAHRVWKRCAIRKAGLRPGHQVLDLAGGSGDLSALACTHIAPQGKVTLADINAAMLNVGRDRLTDRGLSDNLSFVQANAECLPFSSNHFDRIIMGFGLRNVTDKMLALRSMHRVCRPGGRLLILEFSKPVAPGLSPVYDWYSFAVLPRLGQWVAQDKDSYQYLAESIRMHPDQRTLADMIEQAGFADCTVHNLSGGIVALHIAHKY